MTTASRGSRPTITGPSTSSMMLVTASGATMP
jgi:hypothetical protein